jgi:hypothetical protein
VSCAVKPLAVYLAGALLLLAAEAAAQTPDSKGKDKDRPASECDRFAGAAREHCLLQERARVEPPQPLAWSRRSRGAIWLEAAMC